MSVETTERTTSELASTAQEAGGRTGRLLHAIDPVRGRLSDAYTAAQEKSTHAMHSAEEYIKQSPWKALAYAAGVAAALGILGGALLGRRNGTRRDAGE